MSTRIQIVDKSGKTISLAQNPSEALQKNQIRLIVRIILRNDQGKYLLQKRADNLFAYSNCWDVATSGHVDEGELPEQAAYRELEEELGITNIVLTHTKELYHTDLTLLGGRPSRMYSHIYEGTYNGDPELLKLEPTEVVAAKWFTSQQIKELLNSSPDKVTDGMLIIFGNQG